MWKIYYSDHVVSGTNEQQWKGAPDSDVQVITQDMDPAFNSLRTYNPDGQPIVVYGKKLWDGDDVFDPFGWGPKYGRLLSDSDYFLIWNTACGDN